jgi:hypothetical protein
MASAENNLAAYGDPPVAPPHGTVTALAGMGGSAALMTPSIMEFLQATVFGTFWISFVIGTLFTAPFTLGASMMTRVKSRTWFYDPIMLASAFALPVGLFLLRVDNISDLTDPTSVDGMDWCLLIAETGILLGTKWMFVPLKKEWATYRGEQQKWSKLKLAYEVAKSRLQEALDELKRCAEAVEKHRKMQAMREDKIEFSDRLSNALAATDKAGQHAGAEGNRRRRVGARTAFRSRAEIIKGHLKGPHRTAAFRNEAIADLVDRSSR